MPAKNQHAGQPRWKQKPPNPSAEERDRAAALSARPAPLLQQAREAPATLAAADMAELQQLTGNRAVGELLAAAPTPAVQRKGGGRKEGTFIGDPGAIHLHIDIGSPHLMVGGDRYDIKGTDWNGYSYSRCAEALGGLTAQDRSGVSGGTECRAWLEDVLDGETIPSVGTPGSIQGSHWGQGLIKGYPARPFQKGQ